MGLVRHSVPGFYNGVSQQPYSVRHPTQCEEQLNGWSSLVSGLMKRPPSEHIKFLGYPSFANNNAYVHLINRDETERYIVVIANNDLKVFDLAGNEKVVTFPNGKGYLASTNPRKQFKVVTVADHTFICNTDVIVTMDSAVVPGSITGSKQLFSDLSSTATQGQIFEIAGDPTNKFDNYYVIRSGAVYLETAKPGILKSFNKSTLPHFLVRESNGTFTFRTGGISYADREVGDDESSPIPSFVGGKISDIFFHRNRLGFTSNENIVFSRAGDFFNFWRSTVLDVVDSDPIDVSVSHTKISEIKYAVPYNKSLLLFSLQTQFILSGSDALTPKTIKIDQATEFETVDKVRPVGVGPNVYFVTEKGNYAGVREYYVSEDTITNDAADITKHVPSYLPLNIHKIAASSVEDVLFFLSSDVPNKLYVYKYYWQGSDKKQASWSTWTFNNTDVILGLGVIGSTLYMVVNRTDGMHLEKIDFQDSRVDNVGFLVHLDRRTLVTGVYNPVSLETTFTAPYAEPGELQVVLGNTFGVNSGSTLATTKVNNNDVKVIGNYSGGQCWMGRPYTFSYTMSTLTIPKDGSAMLFPKIQARYMELDYADSGDFDIKVTPRFRSTYVYPYQGKVLGTGSILLGKPTINSGRYRFPLQGTPLDLTIEYTNNTAYPCAFQRAEWEAWMQQRNFAV